MDTTNGLWDQLLTFTPTVGYTYEIHTVTGGDDENSWRARVTYDPDCAVGTNTCTAAQLDNGNQVDDIDGVSGTGDEILLNAIRVGWQHDNATDVCNDHYFFVPDTMGSVTMRNFDLDNTGTITYTRGDGSTVPGTASGNGVWAEDTVPVGAGQSGWWHVQFCYNSGNLYVFESTQNLLLYMDEAPGAPELAITKTDGVTTAQWGDTLNYVINVANVSDGNVNPGKAFGVVVTDAVPAGLTYVSCSMGTAAGSCSESGGVVTWTLTDGLDAGANLDLGLTATVDYWHYGTVSNTATADYNDAYGNNYPDVSASNDVNTIQPPSFIVTKTSDTGGAPVVPGQTVDYTIVVQNPTTSDHTSVVVDDTLPTGMTYVPGSTVVVGGTPGSTTTATDDFSSGSYAGGSGWTGSWAEIGESDGASSGLVTANAGSLRIDTTAGRGAQRTFNVAGATSASLTFDLATSTGGFADLEDTDIGAWGVRVNGGAFQQIGTEPGASSPNPRTVTVDLSSYLVGATTLSVDFRVLAGNSGPGEYFQFDNVTLTATVPATTDTRTNGSGGTLDSGVPPTLVTAADGFDLGAGEDMTITYSATVDDPVASPTQRYLTNTATATSYEDPTGAQGSVTDEIDRTPVLQVVKGGPATALVGDTVTYTFAVSHAPSSDGSPVSAIAVSDDIAGTPTYVSGDDGDGLLESGETWNYTVDYTIGGGDPDPLVNTVSVDGTDLNGEAIPTATDSHSVDIEVPAPSIALSKTTSDTLSAGATITYDLVAENTGNVTLTGVQISEGLSGSTVVGSCPAATLAPGETTSCQFEYTATQGDIDSGSLTNDASVVGTPPGGGTVSDTDAVTLSATADPLSLLSRRPRRTRCLRARRSPMTLSRRTPAT